MPRSVNKQRGPIINLCSVRSGSRAAVTPPGTFVAANARCTGTIVSRHDPRPATLDGPNAPNPAPRGRSLQTLTTHPLSSFAFAPALRLLAWEQAAGTCLQCMMALRCVLTALTLAEVQHPPRPDSLPTHDPRPGRPSAGSRPLSPTPPTCPPGSRTPHRPRCSHPSPPGDPTSPRRSRARCSASPR